MKALLLPLMIFCAMSGCLMADDTAASGKQFIAKYYEIDFEFLNILYSKYLIMHGIDEEKMQVLPRVSPRGLATVLDIHTVKNGQEFCHNFYLGRHILTTSLSAKDHEKLVKGYRELLNKEISTLSEEEMAILVKEDRKAREQRNATSEAHDPFAEAIGK